MTDSLEKLKRLKKETEAIAVAQMALHRQSIITGIGGEEVQVLNTIINRMREEYQNEVRNNTWKRLEGFGGFWINQNGMIEHRRGDPMSEPEDRVLVESFMSSDPWTDYRLWFNGETWRVLIMHEQKDDEGWPVVIND